MNIEMLLAKHITGNCTPVESQLVNEWRAADTRNSAYYTQLETIWHETGKIASDEQPDTDEAWKRLQDQLKTVPVKKLYSTRWKAAAILLVVAGCAGLWMQGAFRKAAQKNKETIINITADNSSRTEKLPDGSVVELEKNSSIFFPAIFTEKTRDISLKGSGIFTISPDIRKPFIIQVNDIQIKVWSTKCMVRSDTNSTTVTVQAGLVKLFKGLDSTTLSVDESINIPVNDTFPMRNLVLKKIEEEKILQLFRELKYDLKQSDTLPNKVRVDSADNAILQHKIKLFNAIHKNDPQ